MIKFAPYFAVALWLHGHGVQAAQMPEQFRGEWRTNEKAPPTFGVITRAIRKTASLARTARRLSRKSYSKSRLMALKQQMFGALRPASPNSILAPGDNDQNDRPKGIHGVRVITSLFNAKKKMAGRSERCTTGS